MTNKDFQIWQLIQDVIAKDMGEGYSEDKIIDHIAEITHNTIDMNDIQREITRQKRMIVN